MFSYVQIFLKKGTPIIISTALLAVNLSCSEASGEKKGNHLAIENKTHKKEENNLVNGQKISLNAGQSARVSFEECLLDTDFSAVLSDITGSAPSMFAS